MLKCGFPGTVVSKRFFFSSMSTQLGWSFPPNFGPLIYYGNFNFSILSYGKCFFHFVWKLSRTNRITDIIAEALYESPGFLEMSLSNDLFTSSISTKVKGFRVFLGLIRLLIGWSLYFIFKTRWRGF